MTLGQRCILACSQLVARKLENVDQEVKRFLNRSLHFRDLGREQHHKKRKPEKPVLSNLVSKGFQGLEIRWSGLEIPWSGYCGSERALPS